MNPYQSTSDSSNGISTLVTVEDYRRHYTRLKCELPWDDEEVFVSDQSSSFPMGVESEVIVETSSSDTLDSLSQTSDSNSSTLVTVEDYRRHYTRVKCEPPWHDEEQWGFDQSSHVASEVTVTTSTNVSFDQISQSSDSTQTNSTLDVSDLNSSSPLNNASEVTVTTSTSESSDQMHQSSDSNSPILVTVEDYRRHYTRPKYELPSGLENEGSYSQPEPSHSSMNVGSTSTTPIDSSDQMSRGSSDSGYMTPLSVGVDDSQYFGDLYTNFAFRPDESQMGAEHQPFWKKWQQELNRRSQVEDYFKRWMIFIHRQGPLAPSFPPPERDSTSPTMFRPEPTTTYGPSQAFVGNAPLGFVNTAPQIGGFQQFEMYKTMMSTQMSQPPPLLHPFQRQSHPNALSHQHIRRAFEIAEKQVRDGDGGRQPNQVADKRVDHRGGFLSKFTAKQLYTMEESFAMNNKPNIGDLTDLARKIGLSETQVKVWFKNRRTKLRKKYRKVMRGDLGRADVEYLNFFNRQFNF